MEAATSRDRLRTLTDEIDDPRMNRTKKHTLHDIIVIAVLAVLCGGDSYVDMENFGKSKFHWLKTFLDLPSGIPSHDTFGRVFARLDPAQFERFLIKWTAMLAQLSESQIIAIDGKTLRRSFDSASDKAAIHMVNAWCVANHLVLGQLATDAKSNEITAMPKLLELLDLNGAIVTADAMHCQKETARKIIDEGGDYVLQVKGNQGTLHEQLQIDWADARRMQFTTLKQCDSFETIEKGHGRIERRRLWCTSDIAWVPGHEDWPGLQSVVMVERQRTINGKTSTEVAHYIASLPGDDAQTLYKATRGHWGVENSLHWCLDVSFGEDDSRVRTGHAAENFSRLRRICLNMLKQETTLKVGIDVKRKRCGWDRDYLLKVLGLNTKN